MPIKSYSGKTSGGSARSPSPPPLVSEGLRYFSRTEDLKRFVLIWSCEKFCSFVFSLLSGQEKGFDKTLYVSPRTYGGLNHIRFAELGKEVSQIQ